MGGPADVRVPDGAFVPQTKRQRERFVDERRSGFEWRHICAGHAGPGEHLGPLRGLAVAQSGQAAFGQFHGLAVPVQVEEVTRTLVAHAGGVLRVAQILVEPERRVPVR